MQLADDAGIEALSMRSSPSGSASSRWRCAKHVASKDERLDGMVDDVIVGDIDLPTPGADWKDAVRQRILSARAALCGTRGPCR